MTAEVTRWLGLLHQHASTNTSNTFELHTSLAVPAPVMTLVQDLYRDLAERKTSAEVNLDKMVLSEILETLLFSSRSFLRKPGFSRNPVVHEWAHSRVSLRALPPDTSAALCTRLVRLVKR